MDYRYVGDGAYLPGVPARHLDKDELGAIADRLGRPLKELLADIEACGLYRLRGESGRTKARKDDDTPEPEAPEPVLPTQTGPTGEMVEPAPPETATP